MKTKEEYMKRDLIAGRDLPACIGLLTVNRDTIVDLSSIVLDLTTTFNTLLIHSQKSWIIIELVIK